MTAHNQPMIVPQIRLTLNNGAVIQAPTEVFLVALIKLLPPHLTNQLLAHVEEMQARKDTQIIMPDGGTYHPIANPHTNGSG